MSWAYSRMVRSLEQRPDEATLSMAFLRQPRRSAGSGALRTRVVSDSPSTDRSRGVEIEWTRPLDRQHRGAERLRDLFRWCLTEGQQHAAEIAFTPFPKRIVLTAKIRRDAESAVRAGRLDVAQAGRLTRFYEEGLSGYTYLEERRNRL